MAQSAVPDRCQRSLRRRRSRLVQVRSRRRDRITILWRSIVQKNREAGIARACTDEITRGA